MKQKSLHKNLFLLILGFAFLLTACGSGEKLSDEEVVAQVYTSVAQTLEAQPTLVPPTATIAIPVTITPAPTMTPLPTSPVSATATMRSATAVPCKEALYMTDVTIPDGTAFAPGESFVKTWQLFNAGTCAWQANYALSFVSGEEMGGIPTALGAEVAANGQAQVSVSMTAPLTVGSYKGYWQMTDETGVKFGNAIYVEIVVGTPATATTTPVPIATVP